MVASGITRQMSRARPATGVSESRRAATKLRAVGDVSLLQSGCERAFGQRFRHRGFQSLASFAGPRRDYPIGADFAGNSRTRNVSFCHKNLHLAFST